jgi:hypothetical protein
VIALSLRLYTFGIVLHKITTFVGIIQQILAAISEWKSIRIEYFPLYEEGG